MLEALIALAALAGNTVVAAATTDAWEAARRKFAQLLGRGDPKKEQLADKRLEETHQQLEGASGQDLEKAQADLEKVWQMRLQDLLEEDPGIEAELRALVDEIRAQLPAGVVSAADHSVAAGRDVNISATSGGVAGGTGAQLTVYQLGAAANRLEAVAGQPVSLPQRTVCLAGREKLLADLDARLSAPGSGWPRLVALHGLGGAGKTSLAVEYAHRHIAEVGLAWQFPAEDPEVLLAEFARLAAQLGAREVADARDPVASVHAVLAAFPAEWLLIFDNAPNQGAVQRFLPPAGRGRVLITSQSAMWPPGQAMEVPVLDTKVAAGFLVNRTRDPNERAATDLAQELGGLPLALEQAAAYNQATGTTLVGYLSLFADRRADLLARGEATGHPADVAATLGLALSRLEEEAPYAAGLLRLLACLAPEPVPLTLLLSNAEITGELDIGVAAVLMSL